MRKPVNRVTSVAVDPTAPSAIGPEKRPYDGDIRHIEQDLQNIRQHQRQAEGKDLLPEPAMRQAAGCFSFP